MPDREKVISGLEHCRSDKFCEGCPYQEGIDLDVGCEMPDDALALLREQEPVLFFEIRKVRVTHKTWYSMKSGGRLLYVLEWWDENA